MLKINQVPLHLVFIPYYKGFAPIHKQNVFGWDINSSKLLVEFNKIFQTQQKSCFVPKKLAQKTFYFDILTFKDLFYLVILTSKDNQRERTFYLDL